MTYYREVYPGAGLLAMLRQEAADSRAKDREAHRHAIMGRYDHSALTRHRTTAEHEAAAADPSCSITYDMLVEHLGDPTDLPVRTHETYMQRWRHADWLRNFNKLDEAISNGDAHAEKTAKTRLRSIPTEFRRPARKRTAKKAVPSQRKASE